MPINKKLINRANKLIKLMYEKSIYKSYKDNVKRVTLKWDYIPGKECPYEDPRRPTKKCMMCAKCKYGKKRYYDLAIPTNYLKGLPDMKEGEFEKYFGTELALYYRIRNETVEFVMAAGWGPRKKWW